MDFNLNRISKPPVKSEHKCLFRCAIKGGKGVGKTSLIERYVNGKF